MRRTSTMASSPATKPRAWTWRSTVSSRPRRMMTTSSRAGWPFSTVSTRCCSKRRSTTIDEKSGEQENAKDDDVRGGVSRGVVLRDADKLGAAARRQGARGTGQGAEGRQDAAPARPDGERQGRQADLGEVRGGGRQAAALHLHDER